MVNLFLAHLTICSVGRCEFLCFPYFCGYNVITESLLLTVKGHSAIHIDNINGLRPDCKIVLSNGLIPSVFQTCILCYCNTFGLISTWRAVNCENCARGKEKAAWNQQLMLVCYLQPPSSESDKLLPLNISVQIQIGLTVLSDCLLIAWIN